MVCTGGRQDWYTGEDIQNNHIIIVRNNAYSNAIVQSQGCMTVNCLVEATTVVSSLKSLLATK